MSFSTYIDVAKTSQEHQRQSGNLHTQNLIPIRVLRDHSKMREVGQRTQTLRISFQLVESFTDLVNHLIEGCKSQIRELFFAQFFPHMLRRIELRTVGRLSNESDIFRDREFIGQMPPRLIHL